MSGLELKFLGEVEVLRDGEPLALPPSKKTRALLAYLALSARPSRRDHLCDLLWEIPDDPRGSLRWSLSKLRRLVDDSARTRILADRNQVSFDAE
ncbi:MAG TPA: alpha/beta hydrolase, partial [Myxococcota bacterium]